MFRVFRKRFKDWHRQAFEKELLGHHELGLVFALEQVVKEANGKGIEVVPVHIAEQLQEADVGGVMSGFVHGLRNRVVSVILAVAQQRELGDAGV